MHAGVAVVGAGRSIATVHSLTKVGSGYSLRELNEVLETLAPHWRKVERKDAKVGSMRRRVGRGGGGEGECSPCTAVCVCRTALAQFPEWMNSFRFPSATKDSPDVIMDDPNNALVVEVKAQVRMRPRGLRWGAHRRRAHPPPVRARARARRR
jgi:hypothetical protein